MSTISRFSLLFAACLLFCLPVIVLGDDGEAAFLSNTRQLIYEGRRSGEGYFSPDGKALILQSEREPGNPFFQIYILDLETGDSHLVSTGLGKTTCAFFRPGTNEVLFASSHLDPDVEVHQKHEIELRASGKERRYSWDYDVHMDIFSANRNGSGRKRLTDAHGYDAEGSYSPDGSKIVFCSLRQAYGSDLSDQHKKLLAIDPAYFGEIYIMNADGTNQTRLTDTPGYDGGPFFSPDGERIIWRRFEENGALADIYTMRTDGSDVRRMTDFKTMSWAPFYHPSGKYVLFASNKLGFANFEIYMVDAAGERQPVRVTHTDGFDGLPVFSPDGKKLCWTSGRTRDKKAQLFITNWNHAAALAALSEAPMQGHEQTSNSQNVMVAKMVAANGGLSPGNSDADAFSPEIRSADFEAIVDYLASDKLEGRMSGSNGTRLAADYISARLQEIGLEPLGDNGTYLQQFEFTSGMRIRKGDNLLEISTTQGTRNFTVEQDFRPLAFSTNGEVAGEVVFAGYGLAVPDERGADAYDGLDVKDKIVLILRYVPEDVEMDRRQKLNMYAGLRYKAMIAREHGAKGMLVVSGPNSPKAGQLVPLSYDISSASSGIVAASVSGEVADLLFSASGKTLKEVQSELDQENPHYQGRFLMPDIKVRIRAGVERIRKKDYNVVAVLPATVQNPNGAVVVGAHYDHIGFGEIGSLARKGEEGQIHNGADDNASGAATVLEVAAALAAAQKAKPEAFNRDIIFTLWSGEELGIIGSSAFTENPPVPVASMAAYVNFDMVGRLHDNKLLLQGTGSSSVWNKMIEKRNVAAGFDLVLQTDPYQPTDITAFYPKGVPVLGFFTGSHEDYNRPTDDPETLNYAGMERIGKFAKLLILDLVKNPDRPDYIKVARTKSEGGNRETMRAYLGTIPDYVGGDMDGVKLSGVSGSGPADKAGLKGGDIIVEFAGKKITNIYDYTYAIDAVKIGEPVEVVVLRDGEKLTLTIVPEARD